MGVIIGMIIGATLGIILMCLVQVNRTNDDINLRVKLERLVKKWKDIKTDMQDDYENKEYESSEEKALEKNLLVIAELVSEELENIL